MTKHCPDCGLQLDPQNRCPRCGGARTDDTGIFWPLSITAGVIVLLIVVSVLLHGHFGDISEKVLRSISFPAETRFYEVHVAPPSGPVPEPSTPMLSHEELAGFRQLLMEQRFDALTQAAQKLQQELEADPLSEYRVYDFYRLFETPEPAYGELLDQWVAAAPSHFAPLLARAHYHFKMGWQSRGTQYAAETSEEQFSGMRHHFQKTSRDATAALGVNPKLLTAYILLIGVHNAQGEEGSEEAVFLQGRALFPASLLLYSHMLQARRPRWGGSYAEMERIAAEALDQVDRNPRLFSLFGMIYADQAWYRRKAKQYDEAVALYDRAIAYGGNYQFFLERGRTYSYMKRYDDALQDMERCISRRPVVAEPYGLRVRISAYRGDADQAMEGLRAMETCFPGDQETRECRAWAANHFLRQGHAAYEADPERAVAGYGRAVELDPQLAEAFHWRGSALAKLKRNDLARADIQKAIELDPSHFPSYRMLDYLLASQEKWDEIIVHWDRFLALEPDHADAYLERAGAFRHKGDMANALADLKRACDFGNPDACKYLKRYETP